MYQLNSLNFLNTFEVFQNFLTFVKLPVAKKIHSYDRETVSSMAKKILKFHGILLRKHIQNSYRFEKYKNERIYMDLIWMDMKIG